MKYLLLLLLPIQLLAQNNVNVTIKPYDPNVITPVQTNPDYYKIQYEAMKKRRAAAREYIEAAKVAIDSNQYSDAATYCDEAILIDKDSHVAYALRAYSKNELGNYDGAMRDIKKAISKYTKDPWYYIIKGLIYEKLGDAKNMCLMFKKADRMGSQDAFEYLKEKCKK